MQWCRRLLLAEDTYGRGFHSVIIDKLTREAAVLGTRHRPVVERMYTGKCNPKLRRAVVARAGGSRCWRALFVIDKEDRPSAEAAAEADVLRHFRGLKDRVRVSVAVPRHEAWLCVGLGGDARKCRTRPEQVIERIIGRKYEKRMLEDLAVRVDVERLLSLRDFRVYVGMLGWLLS